MVYTPGKYLVIADTLSRSYLHLPPGPTSTEDDVEIHVCAVISNLMVTAEKWKEIANKTQKDETLQKVIQSINSEHKIYAIGQCNLFQKCNLFHHTVSV